MGYCLMCQEKSTDFICWHCLFALKAHYMNILCSRCGKNHSSSCDALFQIQEVYAPFLYSNWVSDLIVAAKHEGRPQAILLFRSVLFPHILETLFRFIEEHKPQRFIMAPFRKERVFLGKWHPLWDVEKALRQKYPFITFLHLYTERKGPHAQIKSKERKVFYEDFLLNESGMRTLFVDDILTTGSTALEIFSQLNDCSSRFIFCMFRSPQK